MNLKPGHTLPRQALPLAFGEEEEEGAPRGAPTPAEAGTVYLLAPGLQHGMNAQWTWTKAASDLETPPHSWESGLPGCEGERRGGGRGWGGGGGRGRLREMPARFTVCPPSLLPDCSRQA